MKYLYLSVLPIFLALTFEFFEVNFLLMGVPEQTLTLVTSVLYVVGGTLMIAFVAGLNKVKQEQKYILYLVIITIMALRVFTLLKETLF